MSPFDEPPSQPVQTRFPREVRALLHGSQVESRRPADLILGSDGLVETHGGDLARLGPGDCAKGRPAPEDPHDRAAVQLTASFGLATMPDDARSKDELLSVADAFLFQSKREGRNRIVCTEP